MLSSLHIFACGYIDLFSKLFIRHIRQEIYNKVVIDPTSSYKVATKRCQKLHRQNYMQGNGKHARTEENSAVDEMVGY